MSTDQTTEHSSLFDSDDEGEDIFSSKVSPSKKETKKAKSGNENDPFLQILDSEITNISPYPSPSTQFSEELESQNIADSSEDLEKQLVAEKARSDTYGTLNTDLYEKLESIENEFEQTKSDYAIAQEKLSSILNEESQWNSQKEALKAQLRISQDEIQKLKTENEELGLKTKMEDSSDANVSSSLLAIERERDIALSEKEETEKKLQNSGNELSALRQDKEKQDNYISKLKAELAQNKETISKLEKKASSENEFSNRDEMISNIKKLEKEISLKDQRISELEDLAVIARRSQRQEQDMKLQQEKIVTLERKIDFLQKQDHRIKNESIREMTNRSPTGLKEITVTASDPEVPTITKPDTQSVEPVPKQDPEPLEVPRISNHASKSVPVSSLPPHEGPNKTTVIIDKQTGKSLRTATLEERIKKFTGSSENILAGDETSATRHTFRRVSSSGSARSTPSPDLINPRSSSQPVSPDIDEDTKLSVGQSLPPGAFQAQKIAPISFKKTYSPQPVRAKVDVNPDYCIACGRRAYPIEKVTVDKIPYHKFCFKCSICKSILRPGRHASYEGTIYCLNHFKQEFLGGGGKYPGQVRY